MSITITLRSSKTGKEINPYYDDELQKVLTEVRIEYDCCHPSQKNVNVQYKNGKIHTWLCCMRCGKKLDSKTKESELPVVDVKKLQDDYEDEYQQKRFEVANKIHQEDKKYTAEYRRKYRRYLTTDIWRNLRKKILERANYVCEGCYESKAVQVHHLTYDGIMNEVMFDLVAVCESCHKICHPEHHVDFYSIFDDLPCLGCRFQSDIECVRFDCSMELALVDDEKCGEKLNGFEGLR